MVYGQKLGKTDIHNSKVFKDYVHAYYLQWDISNT